MTKREFRELVKLMRATQHEFFRTRNEGAKHRAIALERQVDADNDRYFNPPQPTLFDTPTEDGE